MAGFDEKSSILVLFFVVVALTGCINVGSSEDNSSSDDDNNLSGENILEPPMLSVYLGDETSAVILDDWCLETDDALCEIEIGSPNEHYSK